MRFSAIIVITLLSLALILYWVPIKLGSGDEMVILGGYPWIAPTEQARSTFISLGLVLTAIFAALIIFEIKISKDLEGSESEEGLEEY
ncbi:MAG: hypothetical protein QW291_07570 [Thermofilaceae archaeon]